MESTEIMNYYKEKIKSLISIQKEARKLRNATKKNLDVNLKKDLDALIKSIVKYSSKYRNLITARESRIKKKKEPICLEKKLDSLY